MRARNPFRDDNIINGDTISSGEEKHFERIKYVQYILRLDRGRSLVNS